MKSQQLCRQSTVLHVGPLTLSSPLKSSPIQSRLERGATACTRPDAFNQLDGARASDRPKVVPCMGGHSCKPHTDLMSLAQAYACVIAVSTHAHMCVHKALCHDFIDPQI